MAINRLMMLLLLLLLMIMTIYDGNDDKSTPTLHYHIPHGHH